MHKVIGQNNNMQPDFKTLKPVGGQPDFSTLKPVGVSPSPLDGFANAQQSVLGAGLQAGKESLVNLPESTLQFGKGILEAVKNPVETVKGVGGILGGLGSKVLESTVGKGVEKITGVPVQKADTQQFDALVGVLKDRYGSLENLQKTATEDPFGFGADILSVIEGGAGLVGKTQQLNRALSKTASVVTKPASKVAETIADTSKATARFGISQATGLNPETITEVIKNPQKFKEMNPELRVQTAQQVADTLETRLAELSDVGKGYEAIRQFEVPVSVPKDTVSKVLNKYGVKLDGSGNIITSPESRPLSAVDKSALQDFINNYGKETQLTSNSFLNTREALSNLSKFEQGKTSLPTQIARDLRKEYDALGKSQIPGLANLDAVYAPERQLLSQLKKDILTPTGELKDGAISKIANITGKGKENLLERMKQIVPDIEERVRVIKAVENIESASGIKAGTYVKSGIVGAGVLTGNFPAIVAAIISQPEIAVPLLKGAGYVGKKARPILEAVKTIANDVNNFQLPAQFKNSEGQLKMGASIEDVTKNNPLLQEAKKYKSAEEFVKAKTNALHGSDTEITQFDTKFLGKNTESKGAKDTFFFTSSKEMADEYGRGAFLKKKVGELGDLTPEQRPQLLAEAKGKAKINEVALDYKNPKIITKRGLLRDNQVAKDIQKAKEQGYDAIIYKDVIDPVLGDSEKFIRGDITAVFDAKNIKTKSQLTDIWNKANKK